MRRTAFRDGRIRNASATMPAQPVKKARSADTEPNCLIKSKTLPCPRQASQQPSSAASTVACPLRSADPAADSIPSFNRMMLKMASPQGENELLSELKTERIDVAARDAMKEPPQSKTASPPTEVAAAKDVSSSATKDLGGEANEELEDDVAMTFPQRLMEILDNEANTDTIAWLHHGRGFVIFRKKAFEQKILPKYFSKQSKYSSFTRKLNRWGFTRVTRGPEAGAYYHQYFQRGGHRLLLQMSCQSGNKTTTVVSGAAAKGASSPSYVNLAAAAGSSPGAAAAAAASAPSLSPSLRPAPFGLSHEQLLLHQQQHHQQMLMQYQIQQQLLQQEAARRALFAASLNAPHALSGIPSASFQQQQQHQQEAALYSQLVAAQLAQAGLGGGADLGDPAGSSPAAAPGGSGGTSSSLGASFLHWKNFPSS